MSSQYLTLSVFLTVILVFSSCDDADEPVKEDVSELITEVVLTFTPDTGPVVTVTATDPDGDGVQEPEPDGPINLVTSMPYTLTIQLHNTLVEEANPSYDISAEVEEEGDEHLFFFSWTNEVFYDPVGDGNIDNRTDDVNYLDTDDTGLPIGLSTMWRGNPGHTGVFRILLKHQPDLKSETSTGEEGEADLDLTFTVNVN